MRASASRVASLHLASMTREACIIATGVFGGSRCMVKNRDRNYEPKLKVYHEVRNGVEVLYVKDEVTGWLEGINEHGIGIVNAALMVGHDEAEKKLVKSVGKKSKDGERILKVLEQDTLDKAVDKACKFKGGIKGHTFISSPDKTFSIETMSKHECVTKEIKKGLHVRTNHGISYPDAGYTEGENYISSVSRRDQAKKVLKEVDDPKELAPSLYGKRKRTLDDPTNMVRDTDNTDNMRTTSQITLDLTSLVIHLYLIPGKVKYVGYEKSLPKGHDVKLTLKVYEYTDIDNDGDFDVVRRRKTASGVAQRVASRFLMGTL